MAEVATAPTTNSEISPSVEAGSSSQLQPAVYSSTPSLTTDRGSLSSPTESGSHASTEETNTDAANIQVVVQR